MLGLQHFLIRERKPDVIILDNIMPQLDGIGVLKHLQAFEANIKPKVVAITAAPSAAYIYETNRLGADYIISRNMDIDEIIDRCILVVRSSPKPKILKYTNLEKLVTSCICSIGVPANISGYPSLRTSIVLTIENPDIIHSITGKLYPEIARIHNTTPSKVERNIRSAIEIAWTKGNKQAFEELFGPALDLSGPRPTNSKFIAMVADKLRLSIKGLASK